MHPTFLDNLVHDSSLVLRFGILNLGGGFVELLLVGQRGAVVVGSLGRAGVGAGVGVVLRHINGCF